MRRYAKIFLFHFQDVIQNKGKSFIYFLMSLLNPLLLLLFWSGAIQQQAPGTSRWSLDEMKSYYLLMTLAISFLIVHIEEDVAFHDIKEGVLAKYLLRPFSYFISKFMEELPWRITQVTFGLLIVLVFFLLYNISLPITSSFEKIIPTLVIVLFALVISYTFKMVLGLLAMWTTDFWGILSIEEMMFLVFGGIAMPLTFYPSFLEKIAYLLPLAYIVYFPVQAVQGKIEFTHMIIIIGIQLLWICILLVLYQFVWLQSLKKFTAVGQ